MTIKKTIKSLLVSMLEKAMEKYPIIKDCVIEAKHNIDANNPFIDIDKPEPVREVVIQSSQIDKDYGKLKGPAKKHYVN